MTVTKQIQLKHTKGTHLHIFSIYKVIKVFVHLMITIQKEVHRDFLITLHFI